MGDYHDECELTRDSQGTTHELSIILTSVSTEAISDTHSHIHYQKFINKRKVIDISQIILRSRILTIFN